YRHPVYVCSPSVQTSHSTRHFWITARPVSPSTVFHCHVVSMLLGERLSSRWRTSQLSARLASSQDSMSSSPSLTAIASRMSLTPKRSLLSWVLSRSAMPARTASSSLLIGAAVPKSADEANSMPMTPTPLPADGSKRTE